LTGRVGLSNGTDGHKVKNTAIAIVFGNGIHIGNSRGLNRHPAPAT